MLQFSCMFAFMYQLLVFQTGHKLYYFKVGTFLSHSVVAMHWPFGL